MRITNRVVTSFKHLVSVSLHVLPSILTSKQTNVCPSQLKSDENVIQIERAFDTYLKRQKNTEIIKINVEPDI